MKSSPSIIKIMSRDDGNRLKGEIFSLRGGLASSPERIFFSLEKNQIVPGDDRNNGGMASKPNLSII